MSSTRLLYGKSPNIISRSLSQKLFSNQYRNILIKPTIKNLIFSSKTISIQHKYSFCTQPPATNPNDNNDNNIADDDSEWEYREVDEDQIKNRNYRVMSWKVVIATIVVLGIGTILFQQKLHQHRQKQKEPQYSSYGESQIGQGEWKMIDMNKQEINSKSLQGKYQIVYFGFTFCPDVCPRELTKMANAMQLLEKRGFKIGLNGDILPIFVSVDPKRDTPELIRKYIRQFHPELYGITGTPQQVATFAKSYKAYFSTPGPNENIDDYIVDHVTMMYIMDRQGQYIGHISTLENEDEMANKVANMIKDVGHSGGFLGKWFKDPSQLIENKSP